MRRILHPLRRWRRLLAAGLLCFIYITAAGAARQLNTRDDPLNSAVFAIERDDLGFIWFASETGLSRFDGRKFAEPSAAIVAAIRGMIVSTLAVDGDDLWIGTRSDGLIRINLRTEQIDRIDTASAGIPATTIREIAFDSAQNVWLATDGGGVVKLDTSQMPAKLTRYLPSQGGLPHARIWMLSVDSDNVLAGTQEGAAMLSAGNDEFRTLQFPAPFPPNERANIEEIQSDGAGGFWIGTWDHGFFHSNEKGVRAVPVAGNQLSNRVSSLILQDGLPVVGFDTGLARYEPQCDCLQPISLANRHETLAPRLFIRSLLALPDGGLLVGTWTNGAFHIPRNGSVLKHVPLAQDPLSATSAPRVQSMLEDRAGYLWVGGYGAGLQRSKQPISATPLRLESVPITSNVRAGAQLIWTIHEDQRGRIWVGSASVLDRFDPATGHWTHFADLANGGALPGPDVRDLLERENGDMLIASPSGLALIDANDSVRVIDFAPPGPARALALTINAMLQDGAGRIWLATYDGLHLLDAELRPLRVFNKDLLGSDFIRDLAITADGRLFVTTQQLCEFPLTRVAANLLLPRCNEIELGLPDHDVQSLEVGSDGSLWIGSQHGLRHVNFDPLVIESLHEPDGLSEENFTERASHLGRSGQLYFGSPNGLQYFDPRRLQRTTETLRPIVNEISVSGTRVLAGAYDPSRLAQVDAIAPYARELRLAKGTRQVLLNFQLLGATRSTQRLEYRIVGLQDWLPASDSESGNYLTLPTGSYDVELRSLEHGVQHKNQMRALRIFVEPFWWERRTIQVGILTAFVFLTILWISQRLGAARARAAWLSSEVAARTRKIEQQKSELAEANKRLYELSIHDGLTGVFNRRHALDEARAALKREPHAPWSIALIDLDHFKDVNDHFGHAAGDQALVEFARQLQNQAKEGDVFGRYGGEEFFCLLRNRLPDEALKWAENLLQCLREAAGIGPDGNIIVTASIGLVALDRNGQLPLETWIARADAALYEAKSKGRNRVQRG